MIEGLNLPVYIHFCIKRAGNARAQIDQTQKIPKMPGMLGMQPAGHKQSEKQGFVDISQNQQSKAGTSNPPEKP